MIRGEFLPLIRLALEEDLGTAGDITTRGIFGGETMHGVLMSKDSGVLAGAEIFSDVFREIDAKTRVEFSVTDGALLAPGDRVATVEGPAVSVLPGERVALNFLGLLSGIATAARRFAETSASRGGAVVLDTRKTIPGLRALSKYAVRVGGASNHRMGLYDMVLLKDNHVDTAGGIRPAVEKIRGAWGDRYRIEVECRTVEEVLEAVGLEVDVIMLDNMSEADVASSVAASAGTGVRLEASGNMNLDSVARMSELGVDYISVGSLTHSVKSFDFSLKTERRH